VRKVKSTRVSHHRFGHNIRPSLRNGFNGFLRALPGDRAFFATVTCETSRKLDASVGASGPHDFAVRVGTARQWCRRVHRIPRPTSVTIAIRPSCWRETRQLKPLICPTAKAIYFLREDWTTQITLTSFKNFSCPRKRFFKRQARDDARKKWR
jgi:hypothetical protein